MAKGRLYESKNLTHQTRIVEKTGYLRVMELQERDVLTALRKPTIGLR